MPLSSAPDHCTDRIGKRPLQKDLSDAAHSGVYSPQIDLRAVPDQASYAFATESNARIEGQKTKENMLLGSQVA